MIPMITFSNYIAFYTIISITTFVLLLLACVCNPKSKAFSKHKRFILSHNFSNDVPTISNSLPESQDDMVNKDDHKLKLVSLNRALPDIPQSVHNPNTSDEVFSNSSTFAVVNFINDDVDSLYAVTNNINVEINSSNHPYARIRNNFLVDSSTENDTDDYSEPRIPVISSSPNRVNIPFRSINVDQNDTYELEPQSHSTTLQINSTNKTTAAEPKKEISYNTISVREPLAKVLAERENIEHHYNEVEEERVSSFYEEIISGSATYSKINEIDLNNKDLCNSASTSYQHNDNLQSEIVPFHLQNYPVYSIVDKKTKRSNCIENNETHIVNNLYTRVNKPCTSTTNINDLKPTLQRYSPPPPLPPPLNKDSQSKLYRNTIMFGSPSNLVNQNYRPEHSETSEPIEERDPGYETVYKEFEYNKIDNCESYYGYEAISNDINDPAYEILMLDNAYETIKNDQNENVSNSVNDNNDQDSENYEIIQISHTPKNIQIKNCNNNGCISIPPLINTTATVFNDDNIDIIEHL